MKNSLTAEDTEDTEKRLLKDRKRTTNEKQFSHRGKRELRIENLELRKNNHE